MHSPVEASKAQSCRWRQAVGVDAAAQNDGSEGVIVAESVGMPDAVAVRGGVTEADCEVELDGVADGESAVDFDTETDGDAEGDIDGVSTLIEPEPLDEGEHVAEGVGWLAESESEGDPLVGEAVETRDAVAVAGGVMVADVLALGVATLEGDGLAVAVPNSQTK